MNPEVSTLLPVTSLRNPSISDLLASFSTCSFLAYVNSTSALVANELKSCSGTVTELFDPEIEIVLPSIDRVCLSLSSLDSRAVTLPLTTSNSSLVAKDSSLALGKYLSSAVVSLIRPFTDGNSDFLA